MTHIKTYIVEKEYYSPKYGVPYSQYHRRIVRGYDDKEAAQEFCSSMNVVCTKCPKRTAMKTRYYVLDQNVYVRLVRKNENNTT